MPRSSKDTKPVEKKKRTKKTVDLSVPALLEKANQAEQARLERAASLENKNEEALRPADIKIRPANPIHWGYGISFDEAIDAQECKELTAFFSQFTEVKRSRGSFLVHGPKTTPEQRRIDWEFGVSIEIEQLRAQLPPKEHAPRMLQLRKALTQFDRWHEIVMLLSTWPKEGLTEAIEVATKELASWPDSLRNHVTQWKNRPELNHLFRTVWLNDEGELNEGELAQATCLNTQNPKGLLQQQKRFSLIKSLGLSGHSGLDLVAAKLKSMKNLEELTLSQPAYTDGTSGIDLKTLLAAPHLQNLKALSLYAYVPSAENLEALASCSQPLERLKFQYGKMKPAAATPLSELAARKRLLSLDLKYNDLGPKGAAKLFSNPEAWQRLRVLDFSANEIGDAGVKAMCKVPFPELRWLSLSSNASKQQLTDKAAFSLASADMPKLRFLTLFGHTVKAKGVAALLESKTLRSLRELNVGYCEVSIPELMDSLGNGEPVPLEGLALGNPRGEGGPADWSRATFMKTVKTLNIESLDARGISDLFECPHLQHLEVLVLGCAYGEEEKVLDVLANASLPGLRYLGLSGHKLTGKSAKKLLKGKLFRTLWGVELMPSYTEPEAWRAFYDAGVPLVGYVHFDGNPANEHTTTTEWREEM